MYEMQDTRSMADLPAHDAQAAGGQNEAQISMVRLSLEGFTHEEAERLVHTRAKYRCGELNESSVDYRRLLFARWLYLHGRIGEIAVPDSNL